MEWIRVKNNQRFTLAAELKAEKRDAVPTDPENQDPSNSGEPATQAQQVNGKPVISG